MSTSHQGLVVKVKRRKCSSEREVSAGCGGRADAPELHLGTLPGVFDEKFNSQLNLGFNRYPKNQTYNIVPLVLCI